MKASVIIPCYNRPDWLRRTLSSVLEQQLPDSEIITVYQAEDDDHELRDWCKSRGVKYIFSSTPSTPKARNTGVQYASGEICIFFDDDVELLPGCLRAHVEAYEDKQIVGVAGRVITMRGLVEDRVKKVGRRMGHVNLLGKVCGDQEYNSLTAQQGSLTPLGCNMSIKASAIKRAGGYDETYIGNAMREETDLAVRALEFGDIAFEPKAAVRHFLAKGGGSRQKSKQEWYADFFFNEGYFTAKFVPRSLLFLARWRLLPYLGRYLLKYAKSWSAWMMPWRQIRKATRLARG